MYRTFEEAREFIRSLHLNNQKECMHWRKVDRPKDIPSNPDRQYKDEWLGWSDFMGTGNPSPKERKEKMLSFEEAREFARQTGLQSKSQWREWASTSSRPEYIPTEPGLVYKEQFQGWGDWLGTNRISDNQKHENYYSYEDAKEYLRQFNFQSEEEFYEWAASDSRPEVIPASPRNTYKVDNSY